MQHNTNWSRQIDDQVIVGYKQRQLIDNGYIYAPYIPVALSEETYWWIEYLRQRHPKIKQKNLVRTAIRIMQVIGKMMENKL